MSPDSVEGRERLIRVVTWNLHGGVGLDRRCDLERCAKALLALRPDIAALQEVDGRTHLGRKPRAFERLAEAIGGHVAEARTTGRGDTAYGHVLWSRWPLRRVKVLRLPGGRFEPRALIEADVETSGGPLRVFAGHFGLVPADRRLQAAFLAHCCTAAEGPAIALGDFNDWRVDGGAVQRALDRVMPELATTRTWPSRRPFVRMDRIYASRGLSFRSVAVAEETRRLSDHLALVAELRL